MVTVSMTAYLHATILSESLFYLYAQACIIDKVMTYSSKRF